MSDSGQNNVLQRKMRLWKVYFFALINAKFKSRLLIALLITSPPHYEQRATTKNQNP